MYDVIGERMKHNYEEASDTRLIRRMPVAIRVDGKAFHTFTRGFKKPFDSLFMHSMQETMLYLCKNIQGCVLGYTQSDEITFLLVDYKELGSSAWFDDRVQKISSIAASMAAMRFNRVFHERATAMIDNIGYLQNATEKDLSYANALTISDESGAVFDARCFNIPKEEACNLIYWRQCDAARNSIQMAGHANFTQRELAGKNSSDIQDMLHEQRGINWNDYPTDCKRGACAIKDENGHWFIDREMPILKGTDRNYVDRLIFVGD